MNFAVSLLSILKVRQDFDTLYPGIDKGNLDKVTAAMLRRFTHFYTDFPTVARIEPETFMNWLTISEPDLKEEERAHIQQVVTAIQKPVPQDEYDGMSTAIRQRALAADVTDILTRMKLKQEPNLFGALQETIFKHDQLGRVEAVDEAIGSSFADLLATRSDGFRFQSRVTSLNRATGGLPVSKAIILGATPDGGKTTFCASEATAFAAQARKAGMGPVIIFSNEGDITDVRLRVYQCGAGVTNTLMLSQPDRAIAMYEQQVGPSKGDNQAIWVINANGWTLFQAERVIRSLRPSVCIWDMLDNMRGFESAPRWDLTLEYRYQWVREKADQYKFLSYATSQISAEYEDEMWPPKTCLKDSKTGKAGACDTIMTFTRSVANDAAKEAQIATFKKGGQSGKDKALQNLTFDRYLGTPKQKIAGDNGARSIRANLIADFNRGRIEDPSGDL